MGDTKTIDPLKTLEVLQALENQIQKMAQAVTNVKESIEQDAQLTHQFSQATEEKFGHLFQVLGHRPKLLPEEFDAPSLWSVLGNIADKFDQSSVGKFDTLTKKYENFISTSELEMNSIRAELTFFSNQSKTQTNQYQNVNTQVLRMQHQKISHLEATIDSMRKNNSIECYQKPTMPSDYIDLVKEVKDLKNEMQGLKGSKDSKFVRYQSLGFSDFDEAQAWFTTHNSGNHFGHVVDFHTALENIFNMITGQDLLSKMFTVYKIHLKDMSQASAVSSFETETPKFFLRTTTVKVYDVVDKTDSYFSGIADWASWDLPYEGMRAKLIKGTQRFRESHQRTIVEGLNKNSPLLALAKIALVDSCEWIHSLIQFIDQTYRDYEHAKFDKIRAWHITTRLASRLIAKVYDPRIGVNNRIDIGDASEIGKLIFWATIKSLSIMTQIREIGFANDPGVSAELVKFLATHTEFDTIKKLSTQQETVNTQISSMLVDLKNLDKSDKTANNKVSEAKDQIKDLKARVVKLEKKA